MVFTDPKHAQQYLVGVGWAEDHTIATLDSVAFVEWLVHCHRAGVDLMATDPSRGDHEAGRTVLSMSIEAHLTHAGDRIVLTANPEF